MFEGMVLSLMLPPRWCSGKVSAPGAEVISLILDRVILKVFKMEVMAALLSTGIRINGPVVLVT